MKGLKPLQAAHLITTIVVALCMAQSAFAQKIYKVGVPVCDTIGTVFISHAALGGCDPYDYLWFRLSHSLIPYVSGLNFQIVITEINGKIWSSLSDTAKIGDILPVPAPTDSGVKVFLATSSSFKFITKIVGTPTVAYENYYCEIKQAQSTVICKNYYAYFGEGQKCQVQPATSVQDKDDALIPAQFQLLQNYPNPFNAATAIQFDLTRASEVTLKVFNLHGEEVATLINQKKLPTGNHSINWNPDNLPSGIYVYRLQASGGAIATRKLVLLK